MRMQCCTQHGEREYGRGPLGCGSSEELLVDLSSGIDRCNPEIITVSSDSINFNQLINFDWCNKSRRIFARVNNTIKYYEPIILN